MACGPAPVDTAPAASLARHSHFALQYLRILWYQEVIGAARRPLRATVLRSSFHERDRGSMLSSNKTPVLVCFPQ